MDERVRNCLITVIAIALIITVYRRITYKIELRHYGKKVEACVIDRQLTEHDLYVKIEYYIGKNRFTKSFRTHDEKKFPLRGKVEIFYHPDYPYRPHFSIGPDELEKTLNRIFLFAVGFGIYQVIQLMVKATAPHTG